MLEEIRRHQNTCHTKSISFTEQIPLFLDTRTYDHIRIPFPPNPLIPCLRQKAFDDPLTNNRKSPSENPALNINQDFLLERVLRKHPNVIGIDNFQVLEAREVLGYFTVAQRYHAGR